MQCRDVLIVDAVAAILCNVKLVSGWSSIVSA